MPRYTYATLMVGQPANHHPNATNSVTRVHMADNMRIVNRTICFQRRLRELHARYNLTVIHVRAACRRSSPAQLMPQPTRITRAAEFRRRGRGAGGALRFSASHRTHHSSQCKIGRQVDWSSQQGAPSPPPKDASAPAVFPRGNLRPSQTVCVCPSVPMPHAVLCVGSNRIRSRRVHRFRHLHALRPR